MASSLYLTGCLHPNRAVRIFMMGGLFFLCSLRCLALYIRELCALSGVLLLLHSSLGIQPLAVVGMLLLAGLLWCWLQAAQRVECIAGHRAGAKGYTGAYVENTIEAMQALIQTDNGPEGPVPDLHYVEIDVQETADGELVILHDFHLSDAFPDSGPNLEPYRRLRQQLGLQQGAAMPLLVKDVTCAQLQSLHLGGRQGLVAPTLHAFLAAFRATESRRPLVVEVKRLQSDAARERLIQLLREHQPYAKRQQLLYPQLAAPRLGFLAIIAFPHYFAASFGEYGSKQWAEWGSRLAALGIPVRCCFLDQLSYVRGLAAAA